MVSDLVPISKDPLTPAQYHQLTDVPPELEWLANITNPKTCRAYKVDVEEFVRFTGLGTPTALEKSTGSAQPGALPAYGRKLSALSSLFDYLCERNAVVGNPVDGVKPPAANGNEGSTPVLGYAQARRLLEAPAPDTLKGTRDRAILATLLYHGIRREELCLLLLRDLQSRPGRHAFPRQGQARQDSLHFRTSDRAAIDCRVPRSAETRRELTELVLDGPLFRPVRNNRSGTLEKPLDPLAHMELSLKSVFRE